MFLVSCAVVVASVAFAPTTEAQTYPQVQNLRAQVRSNTQVFVWWNSVSRAEQYAVIVRESGSVVRVEYTRRDQLALRNLRPNAQYQIYVGIVELEDAPRRAGEYAFPDTISGPVTVYTNIYRPYAKTYRSTYTPSYTSRYPYISPRQTYAPRARSGYSYTPPTNSYAPSTYYTPYTAPVYTPPVTYTTPAPVVAELASIQNNDLIRVANDRYQNIYWVKIVGAKKFVRLVVNQDILNSYAQLRGKTVKDVSWATLRSFQPSNLVMQVYPNGQPVNGQVYYSRGLQNADFGTQRHIQLNAQQFQQAGGDWDAVYRINSTEASTRFYTLVAPITTIQQLSNCIYTGNC